MKLNVKKKTKKNKRKLCPTSSVIKTLHRKFLSYPLNEVAPAHQKLELYVWEVTLNVAGIKKRFLSAYRGFLEGARSINNVFFWGGGGMWLNDQPRVEMSKTHRQDFVHGLLVKRI